jgi:hypothetical protein
MFGEIALALLDPAVDRMDEPSAAAALDGVLERDQEALWTRDQPRWPHAPPGRHEPTRREQLVALLHDFDATVPPPGGATF